MMGNDDSFYANRNRLDALRARRDEARRELALAEEAYEDARRSGLWSYADGDATVSPFF